MIATQRTRSIAGRSLALIGGRGPIRPHPRAGITLTEILISILIMGVGLISLATLFPLGMVRIRDAQRYTRSSILTDSAVGDVSGRNLLNLNSLWNSPWYAAGPYGFFDPWIQDTPLPTLPASGNVITPSAVYRGYGLDGSSRHPANQPLMSGEGLPVAYDPLWWAVAHDQDKSAIPSPTSGRFASGIGFLRNDPNGVNSTQPSAYGLQRVTTLEFLNVNDTAANKSAGLYPLFAASLQFAGDVFTSADDPVLQNGGDPTQVGGTGDTGTVSGPGGSPILPFLGPGGVSQSDWTYTWMFTGRRAGATNSRIYQGDIVIFQNRPFGFDMVGTTPVPAGERVIEAIWGYGTTVDLKSAFTIGTTTVGFSLNDHTVLLRWPASQPDPDIRVGSWIADVTYERSSAESDGTQGDAGGPYTTGRFSRQPYPGQRCIWYKVARRTPVEGEDASFTSPPVDSTYRRMVVTINQPLQAKTLIVGSGATAGTPVHVNAAFHSSSVVNVVSRVMYAH